MFAAALFVLSAFPLELDGGFGVPVEGRAPRVVVANERPHVVWLDPRRQWLDRRNGEAIFTVELPLDGGSAASPGTSLADTAPASREGFSVAGGGSKDFLLVVWEEPSSPTRWNRRVALRLPSGSVETSFGPTGAPALPVAAGWAGEAGLAAWREADGGPIVSQWVRASLGTLPGVSLGLNTTALALGSAGDGGSMWVASVEDGGVSTRRVPLLSTASSSVPPSGAGTHIALDSRGLVLLIQNGPTTRLLPLVTGDSSFVDGGVPLTGRPSVDVTSSGRIFVGLPTGAGGQLWLEQDGGDVPLTIPGPSLSLATIREFAFIAAETPQGQLEVRTATPAAGTLRLTAPSPLALVDTMRRSPSVAWAGDRWVVGWEQHNPAPTKLISVFPDSSIDPTLRSLAGTSPQLGPLEDGGVALTFDENGTLRTANLERTSLLPNLSALTTTPGAREAVVGCPGVLHVGPTAWTYSGMTVTAAPGTTFEAASCLDGAAWLVQRSAAEWRVNVYAMATRGLIWSAALRAAAPNPSEYRQAVISARRTHLGQAVALVGIREGSDVEWLVTPLNGTIASSSETFEPATRGLAVVSVGQTWVVAKSEFTAGALANRVRVFEVDAAATLSTLAPALELGAVEPGVPVLACGRPGEMGLAVPVLFAGQPQLRFTVFRIDAGVSLDGGVIDAGVFPVDAGLTDSGVVFADAGEAVDGAVIIVDDAGMPDAGTRDAGTPDAGTRDAGTPDAGTRDAGTPDAGPAPTDTGLISDAGTPDAGGPVEPLVFLPVRCGCRGGADALQVPLALLWLRRRRHAGRCR